jgi:hypothetical protein
LLGRKRKGRRRGAAGSARLRRQAGEAGGRRKGRGKGEVDKWGPGVSDSKRKEKERGRGGPVRGEGRWAAGPFGPKGKEVRFSFFSFLFQTSFKTTISFQIQIKTLSNFFSKIYKLFRNHTSNQKPCKPTDDAQSLVVSMFIKLCLIF